MSLLWLELSVVAFYLVFLIVVGWVFSRMVRDGDDYFKAGGRGSWWLVGTSAFMGSISTHTFVGNAGGIYKSGLSPLAIYLANVAALALCAWSVAAWYRQMRVVTAGEVLRQRFGVLTEQTIAVLLVVNKLIWSGLVLYGLAVFAGMVLPEVSTSVVIVGVGVIVIGYCTVGGNWAVMANDYVQGLVFVAITTLLAGLCLWHAGGFTGLIEAVRAHPAIEADFIRFATKAGNASFDSSYGLAWFAVAFIAQFFGQVSLFHSAKYVSAKDGKEAARASLLAAGLMLVGCVTFFVPPIYARLYLSDAVAAMNPDPARAADYAYAVTSRALLPQGGFSLMLVAMFGAAITSLDTGLNRTSALIVRNLVPAWRRWRKLTPIDGTSEVRLGRWMTVLCGALIVTLALLYASLKEVTIFDLFLKISGLFMAPQFVPLVLFLFVRKTPAWAALASIFAGFMPGLLDEVLGWGLSYQKLTLATTGTAAAVFLSSRLFWHRVPTARREQIAAFYAQMERPVDFEREVGAANDAAQLKQIGRFAVALGAFASLLVFVPNPLWGRVALLSVGLFVGGTGASMLWRARNMVG